MPRLSPLVLAPPLVFLGLAALFAVGLLRGDPGAMPSTLIGKSTPEIAQTALDGYPSFDPAILKEDGVKIVNFWASWCPPCRAEHPALMQLAAERVPIYGVNKSDDPGDARKFLQDLGNPFASINVDPNGREALDWGVVALPETFIVDGDGIVRYRFPGPIQGVMDTVIRPELAAADEPR